jgi:hypothetical protein
LKLFTAALFAHNYNAVGAGNGTADDALGTSKHDQPGSKDKIGENQNAAASPDVDRSTDSGPSSAANGRDPEKTPNTRAATDQARRRSARQGSPADSSPTAMPGFLRRSEGSYDDVAVPAATENSAIPA